MQRLLKSKSNNTEQFGLDFQVCNCYFVRESFTSHQFAVAKNRQMRRNLFRVAMMKNALGNYKTFDGLLCVASSTRCSHELYAPVVLMQSRRAENAG